MQKIFLLILLSVVTTTGFSQLNGTYTIGGTNPDYPTISAAATALTTNGVNGPVTLNIRPGIYLENITLPQIAGASATNRITFQSELQDSSSVQWRFNSASSATNYVVFMNGADFVTFRHLSLYRDASTIYGSRVVRLENGASNNRFEYTLFKGSGYSGPGGSTDYALVYSTNAVDSANYFGNCTFNRGQQALSLSGTSVSNPESGTTVENCKITCIGAVEYVNYRNFIFRNNNVTTTGPAITLNAGQGDAILVRNRMKVGTLGISAQTHTMVAGDSLAIIGNMITGGNGAAIYVTNAPYTYIYHNSVRVSTPSNVATGAIYLASASVWLYNNIIQNTSGYALYIPSGSVLSDYNIYSASSASIIRLAHTTNYTLASYQNATPYDDHSYNAVPSFISATDLHIISDLNAHAHAINLSIPYDLDGDLRPATPDIGADEFDLPDNDAGATAVTGVPLKICTGQQPIAVNFRNYGEAPLTSATVNWSVNNIPQPAFNWTGALATGAYAQNVAIGNFFFDLNGTYNFKVWLTNPNGVADPVAVNDTVTYGPVKTRMQGVYTIGGASPSFATINASITEMGARGVCGPVTFNIRSGNYNETLLLLSAIDGTSAVNTITYQSEALDSQQVVISWSSYQDQYAFGSSNSSHLRFRHLTFKRSYSSFGSSVHLFTIYASDDVHFEYCQFKTEHPLAGNGINFSNSSYVTVNNCTFTRLEKGLIYDSDELDSVVVVTDNVFKNIRVKNVMIRMSQDSSIFRRNLLINDLAGLPAGVGPASGMTNILCGKNAFIDYNRVEGRFTDALEFSCYFGSPTQRAVMANNFVANEGLGYNPSTGLLIYKSHYVDVLHNNVRVSSGPSLWNSPVYSAVEFSAAFPLTNMRFENNCLQSDSGTYIVRLPSNWTSIFDAFDYNNFYRSVPAYTQLTNQSGWPNTYNAHSLYIDPGYTSETDLHVSNTDLNAGTTTYITDDIDGDIRLVPTTIGADQMALFPDNAESIATNVTHTCDSTTVYAKIKNTGISPLQSCTISFAINGTYHSSFNWTGSLVFGATSNWIEVGTFAREDGFYEISTYTTLPNGAADPEPAGDTSGTGYTLMTPQLNLGADITICSPQTTQLGIPATSGFSGYSWNTGATGNYLTTDTAGMYILQANDEWSCIHSDTIEVFVGGTVVPVITATDETLYSSAPNGNQWFLDGAAISNATADSLVAITAGTYTVELTDSLGCPTLSEALILTGSDFSANTTNLETIMLHSCDSTEVFAHIQNTGSGTLSQLTITLEVNGTPAETLAWTGSIPAGGTELISVGTVAHIFGQAYTIRTYTSLPNGVSDPATTGDTTVTSFQLTSSVADLGADRYICKPNALVIGLDNASDFASILWDDGTTAPTLTVTNAGTYSVTCIDSLGCVMADTVVITEGETITPVIHAENGVLICTPAGGNQWYLEGQLIPGETGDTLSPETAGLYTVLHTAPSGCTSISEPFRVGSAGIAENGLGSIRIFPNPANTAIYLEIPERAAVQLIDAKGSVLRHVTLEQGTSQLDVLNVAPGMYQLRITTASGQVVLKQVIE